MTTTATAHRILRCIFAALEIAAIADSYLKEDSNFPRIGICLIILFIFQIFLIGTTTQMARTFDFRSYESRNWMEHTLNASMPSEEPHPRSLIRERAFIACFVTDGSLRLFTLMMLFGHYRDELSPTSQVLSLLDIWIYIGSAIKYAICLLSDQDYLRNLMEWLGGVEGRIREIGYYNVYSLGYQFSAFPGMHYLALPLFYSVFVIVQTTVMATVGLVYMTADSLCAESTFIGYRLKIVLYDLLFIYVAAMLVPFSFWLEDKPRSKTSHFFSGFIGLYCIFIPQLLYKIAWVPYILHEYTALDASCEHKEFSRLLNDLICANQLLYIFVFFLFLFAEVNLTEYLVHNPNAWQWLLGIFNESGLEKPGNQYEKSDLVINKLSPSFFVYGYLAVSEPIFALGILKYASSKNIEYSRFCGYKISLWYLLYWIHIVLLVVSFLEAFFVYRFTVAKTTALSILNNYKISWIEIVKFCIPVSFLFIPTTIAIVVDNRLVVDWILVIVIVSYSKFVLSFYWILLEFSPGHIFLEFASFLSPSLYSIVSILLFDHPEGRYFSCHRSIIRLADSYGSAESINRRMSLLYEEILSPLEIYARQQQRRKYLMFCKRSYNKNSGLPVHLNSELCDLNYECRRMVLFLTFSARTKNQTYNICKQIYQHEFHLLRLICEFI